MAYRVFVTAVAVAAWGCGGSTDDDAGSAAWSISRLPMDGDASDLIATPDGFSIDAFRDDTPDVADDYAVTATFDLPGASGEPR